MAQFRKDTHQFLNDGKTIFESVMLADQYGNIVGAANPSGMAVDGFGRARTSQPYSLYDIFYRYGDPGKIGQSNSVSGATATYNANAGLLEATVNTTSGSFIKRESTRVFHYQPGKSLQTLQSFNFAPAKEGLRQRYGFFNDNNGFFLEQSNNDIYFVKRSISAGTGVQETRVAQADWNIDPLNGTGPSLKTLDLSKSQILFHDLEWLGVGSVRTGFVIDGRFLHCHTWNYANEGNGTYMTTACLPVRAEIENIGATSSNSTLNIICASIISEGGLDPRGKVRTAFIPLTAPKDIPTAGTFTPLISIRLKDSRRDGIVFPRSIQFFGVTNNTNYIWKIVTNPTLTGASWVSAGDDSSVEYDITATAMTGGNDNRIDYVNVSAGAGAAESQIEPQDIYKYQLERQPFAANNAGLVYTLCATGSSNGADAIGAIQWEEIT